MLQHAWIIPTMGTHFFLGRVAPCGLYRRHREYSGRVVPSSSRHIHTLTCIDRPSKGGSFHLGEGRALWAVRSSPRLLGEGHTLWSYRRCLCTYMLQYAWIVLAMGAPFISRRVTTEATRGGSYLVVVP